MKVVYENTEEDLLKRRALQVVEAAATAMAANLIRVVRGAGRPDDLPAEAVAFALSVQDYREVAGQLPDLGMILALSNELEGVRPYPEEYVNTYYAERSILRGALQAVASELIEQRTQLRAGMSELYQGVNEIHRIRESAQRKRAEEARAVRAAAKKPKGKVRRKVAPKKV